MAWIESRTNRDGTDVHRVRWWLGGRNGDKQSASFADETLADDCKKLAESLRHNITGEEAESRILGLPIKGKPAAPLVTFRAFAEETIDGRTIGDQQRRHYRYVLNTYCDMFADRPVADIDTALARRWLRWLERDALWYPKPKKNGPPKPGVPLADKTIANIHGFVSAVFDVATSGPKPVATHNPCIGARMPHRDEADDHTDRMTFLTPGEFALLVACAEEELRPLLRFAAGTGLRLGELRALKVNSVDVLAAPPTVRVAYAWKRTRSGMVLGRPKTKASRRTVTLAASTVEDVIPLVAGRDDDDWLILSPRGKCWSTSSMYNFWNRAVKKAREQGLRKTPRFHDLRHSHASWLIAARRPMKEISERLGHTSIQTTVDRYGHLDPEHNPALLAAIDAAMASGQEKAPATL